MRFNAILRHKNLTNTILNTIPKFTALTLALIISAHPALAFELPAKITPDITFGDSEETSHTYLSGTVVATASPVTTITEQKITSKKRSLVKAGPYNGEPVVLEGIASYYSKAGCLGCNPLFVMANGQVLDDNALTMAIGADRKHLVGYNARVTNLATGQSAVVRITDTGGFYKDKYGNRVADLTIGTKTAIGMKGGLGRVRVEVL